MGKHVFLSYKHQDSTFANDLIRRVQAAGFTLWVDADQLRAGENWRETINLAIKDSFALVVIITPESKTSEYVTYEWAFAQGAGVKIVPVLLRPTKLHPQLEVLQYLDFSDPYVQPWERLIARLKELQAQFQTNSLSLPNDAPAPVRGAVMALDSHNAEERRSALRTLAQMNNPAAYAALVNAVRHPMRDVRVDAAFMLAKQTNNKETAAVPGLVEALYDEDSRIRTAAVKVLGEIGDPNAVPELLKLLNTESDGSIRWGITSALGRIGRVAVPGLVEALRDENWKVRRSAAEALWAM
ncbi:MAG: HEAT repeat domain-containing protein, partial [Anaerolineae bacterium]|nr:HEAT repeat domain-containing protein [Anaerolineae bacterium]